MNSTLFWNKPPARDATRSVDPLGLDALREAMADRLVPLLTGATRNADEYLWTLIGLRWARKETGTSIDATVFNKGFSPFERGLKQYWYKFHGRKSGGFNVVKKLCSQAQPDVYRPILVDQRATGLLGNYIVSLRGMGLVQKTSLAVVEDAADRLLVDIKFTPPQNWKSSWDGISRAFSGIDLKSARRRLGRCLFDDGHSEMNRAARSVLRKPAASSWDRLGKADLDSEQARLAAATKPILAFEREALEAFRRMLRGEASLPQSMNKALRLLASAARDSDPFPSSWNAASALRSSVSEALASLARGRSPADVLLRLHLAVTRDWRHSEPWLEHLGEAPIGLQNWHPGMEGRDFRFQNLKTLRRQTQWRPHGS